MVKILICLTFLSFFLLDGDMKANKTSLNPYFQKEKMARPQRDISVIISREGQYPKNLVIFKGERVRLFVTTTIPEGSCLSIPSKDIFLTAKRGKISESVLFFNEAGIYSFHCPMGKMQGKIFVLDRAAASYENKK